MAVARGLSTLGRSVRLIGRAQGKHRAARGVPGGGAWLGSNGPSLGRHATVDVVTAKETLRSLVEDLSEEEAASALLVVERHRAEAETARSSSALAFA